MVGHNFVRFLISSAAISWQIAHASSRFLPVGLALGSEPQLETTSFSSFTLNATFPLATLDYGTEAAGLPFFEIASLDGGSVQVEVKYSEPFAGLSSPFSDGPYAFANALANTFRVETFNISTTGTVNSSLLQGGQRWQSLRLLTGGSVTFGLVGFEATVDTSEPEDLPGKFNSSDGTLNEIWKLGARAATRACVEKGSQPATWAVDSEKGVHVSSLRPAVSASGDGFENYTLEFDVLIERGGAWWSVKSPVTSAAYNIALVGELPADTTFANPNYTLFPANTLLVSYGYDFVNQTTVTSYILETFQLPFNVTEDTWYRISTIWSFSNDLSVSLNDTQIFNVSLSSYSFISASYSSGSSFGFGAYQDQTAYFRNVLVTDTSNTSIIYTNPLTSPSVLAEYGTQPNLASVCLDGPKRDRLVWLGDFYHTSRIIAASTSRADLSRGTLQFLLDTQIPNGQLGISPPMGYDPSTSYPAFYPDGEVGLPDYQILGLLAFHAHVRAHADLAWARSTWSSWQKTASWLLNSVNETDGLVYLDSYSFLGPFAGGSAISCAAVAALNGLSEVATALNDTSSASEYSAAARSVADAVNNQLWDEDRGIYALSPDSPAEFSVTATGLCILSGVASTSRAAHLATSIETLRLGVGYKDSTQVNSSDPSSVSISPNTNGFLLEALFAANATTQAADLLTDLWGAMLKDNETATGASWEYVMEDGTPGLGLFTSLSHPWGGAATYLLTERVAGLRMAEGMGGFGYGSWVVGPEAGVKIGLRRASASVVTGYGGDLSVAWSVVDEGKSLNVTIEAPAGTSGVFVYGEEGRELKGESRYVFVVGM